MTVHELLIAARALLADPDRFSLAIPAHGDRVDLWSSIRAGAKGKPNVQHPTFAAAESRVLAALRRRGFASLDDFAARGSQADALKILDDAIGSTPSVRPAGS